jgi:acyl-CoA thioesterase
MSGTKGTGPSLSREARAKRVVELMFEHDTFSQWLGVEILSVEPARVTTRMTVRPDMLNGFAVCHGGVTFGFADSAFAFACNTQGNLTVSIENCITYPAAARAGDVLTAVAEEEAGSNRILYYRVVVTKADGSPVGLFRGTAYRTEKPVPGL